MLNKLQVKLKTLRPWTYKKVAIVTLAITLLFLVPLLMFYFTTNHSVSALNLNANLAVGQADLMSSPINASGSGTNPFGYDSQSGVVANGTHLFVSDLNNNRVLIYNTIPSVSSASADLVIGQSDMFAGNANQGATVSAFTLSGPRFIDTDGTKVFIADTNNNRVLIYNTIPVGNNVSADVVIGQPDMASSSANQGNASPSASTLNHPESVTFDQTTGKLLITDTGNNRILIFNTVPSISSASADLVIGQPDFVTPTLGAVSGQNLSSPSAARIIQSQLIIADTFNNRVLTFNPVPTTDYASASAVIGQFDIASSSANQGGAVAANTLSTPTDIIWDGTRLLVQDSGNNRILAFPSIPTTDNALADDAIGQINLTSSSIGTTSATLNNPQGELSFSGTTLFVGDSNNNRVLAFNNFGPSPTPTNTPTPTLTPTTTAVPPSSNTTPFVCTDTKPENPSGLTVSAGPTSTQLTLTWVTAASSSATDYSIVYSDNNTTAKWGVVSTGNVSTYTIRGLNANTTYYFWVNAINGCMPGDRVGPANLNGGSVSTTSTPSGITNNPTTGTSQLTSLTASGSAKLPPTGPSNLVKFGGLGLILMIFGGALLLVL